MQVEQQEQVDKADEEQYLEEEEVGICFPLFSPTRLVLDG